MCSRFREAAVLAGCLILASCQQQPDRQAGGPPPGALVQGNRQTSLQAGQPFDVQPVRNPFEGDQEALAEGKRLYDQFNCAGCHAAGGGAIGPPLMDDEWIYGSTPANIFWTIIEGRPQGMPAFGGRIAEDEVWRIVAHVRSLSGLHKRSAETAGQPQTRPGQGN